MLFITLNATYGKKFHPMQKILATKTSLTVYQTAALVHFSPSHLRLPHPPPSHLLLKTFSQGHAPRAACFALCRPEGNRPAKGIGFFSGRHHVNLNQETTISPNGFDFRPLDPLYPPPFLRYFYGISTVVLRFKSVILPLYYRNTTVEMREATGGGV